MRLLHSKVATRGVLKKKVLLEILQNSQKSTCARVSFFIKKETLAQVFPCEFCKISKNTIFTQHLWTTASIHLLTEKLKGTELHCSVN